MLVTAHLSPTTAAPHAGSVPRVWPWGETTPSDSATTHLSPTGGGTCSLSWGDPLTLTGGPPHPPAVAAPHGHWSPAAIKSLKELFLRRLTGPPGGRVVAVGVAPAEGLLQQGMDPVPRPSDTCAPLDMCAVAPATVNILLILPALCQSLGHKSLDTLTFFKQSQVSWSQSP